MKKFLFSALLLLCCGCSKETNQKTQTPKPLVLVSLAPYQHFLEKISKDVVEVRTVVPPTANPHAYEPTAKDMQAIQGGALWFRIGEFFEAKLLPALQEQNPEMVDIDLREGISLLHNRPCCQHSSSEDRHIWLSPLCLIKQIETMVEALSHRFPEHKDFFTQNGQECILELQELDTELKTMLEPVTHRTFFVSHSAFAYFCKEYNLRQISIELGGKDPTSAHLTEIIAEMQQEQTKWAIAMPQHSNKGLEFIADKLHLQVKVIDPYAKDATATMRKLALTMKDP